MRGGIQTLAESVPTVASNGLCPACLQPRVLPATPGLPSLSGHPASLKWNIATLMSPAAGLLGRLRPWLSTRHLAVCSPGSVCLVTVRAHSRTVPKAKISCPFPFILFFPVSSSWVSWYILTYGWDWQYIGCCSYAILNACMLWSSSSTCRNFYPQRHLPACKLSTCLVILFSMFYNSQEIEISINFLEFVK